MRRIPKAQAQLERLEKSQQEQQAEVIAAAEALGKRTGGHSGRLIDIIKDGRIAPEPFEPAHG